MIQNFDFWNMEPEHYWSCPKKENPNTLAKNMIFSGDFIGARKVDGYWNMILKEDNELKSRSRDAGVTGEFTNKINWLPHIKSALDKLPDGTVLIGELYLPKKEGSKNVTSIMGCLMDKAILRQTPGNELHFYIFDILAWDNISMLTMPLEKRISFLNSQILNLLRITGASKFIHVAEYYEGEKLWNYISWALDQGYEGAVIQRKDSLYAPGKRTARKSLKIKKEIEIKIDAFLTGNVKIGNRDYAGTEPEHWNYWLNTRTGDFIEGEKNYDDHLLTGLIIPVTKDFFYGLPASIEFAVLDKNGEDKHLCWISNITDELKWEIKNSPNNCRGKVAIITAMEIDNESGKLRHSKVLEWRGPEDMNYKDCTFDKIN